MMKFVFYDALYLSRRGRAYLVKPAIYIAPPPVGAQYLGFSVAHQRLPAMKSGAICTRPFIRRIARGVRHFVPDLLLVPYLVGTNI